MYILYLCRDYFWGFDMRKDLHILIYIFIIHVCIRSFEIYAFAYDFDCPEVTLCG